jgi:ABC-type cobalamin/Fe3+-siderophores transport system ATPase subunit
MFKKQPASITVVLGPRSCGKTTLLKSLLKETPHAVFIDCREIDASTPATFVEALLTSILPKAPMQALEELLNKLRSVVMKGLSANVKWPLQGTGDNNSATKEEVTFSVTEAFKELVAGPKQGSLNDVYKAFKYVAGKRFTMCNCWPTSVCDI